MFIKNLIKFGTTFVCLICLTSWTFPQLSRQKVLPPHYGERINKLRELKKEEKEIKQKQKAIVNDYHQSRSSAHQKNRLISFADKDGFIWFYNKDNKYTYFLGNFFPTNIHIWNMRFLCAEAAFQAAKFMDQPKIAARFIHLDGEEAWRLGQKLSYQQRKDWYQVRENIMLEVLRAKFQQHVDLTELLLSTGDAYLVEHTHRDAFWADGGDGTGKNRLGYLLMQVRGELGGVGPVSKPKKYKQFVD